MIRFFIFDPGISTLGCITISPLRIRVNKSAIGSVIILQRYSKKILVSLPQADSRVNLVAYIVQTRPLKGIQLPTGLRNTRNFTTQCSFTKTNSAHTKFPQEGSRPSADIASVISTNSKTRCSFLLDY